jgi:hypothetical protein
MVLNINDTEDNHLPKAGSLHRLIRSLTAAAAEERTLCRLRSLRNRCLPQDFAKFLFGRCHVTLVARAMRTGGGASVVPIEQAFASHAFDLR